MIVVLAIDFAKEVGFGPLVAASSMGVMAVINGIGRGVVGWLSDRWGRKPTLVFVIVVLGLAQFGVIWSGDVRSEALFLFFAFLSGFGGGAFYPLFAALTPDYFGENYNASNYGLVYSGKLISGLFGGGLGSMVMAAWGGGTTGRTPWPAPSPWWRPGSPCCCGSRGTARPPGPRSRSPRDERHARVRRPSRNPPTPGGPPHAHTVPSVSTSRAASADARWSGARR